MKIENIVASGYLGTEIDLDYISSNDDNIVYGQNKYPAAYVKFNGYSVTVYHSGKYIIPGTKSELELSDVYSELLKILGKWIDTSRAKPPIVYNIVASSIIGHELDLVLLYAQLIGEGRDVVYEPESFPGLILKTNACTYNVFSSGKFIILGCSDCTQLPGLEHDFVEMISELKTN